ncbi:hypothetical protein AB0392_12065 [Nonomuraea angiospora]|uniref:hypothetical protein n=1 Tax=Nonomuraea angiospora TaxID=46172 RepID=UPI00344E7AE5
MLRTEFEPPAPHIELLFNAVRHLDLPVPMSGGLVIEVDDRRPGDTDDVTFLLSNDPFAGHLFMKQEERSRYSAFSLFHGYLRTEHTR